MRYLPDLLVVLAFVLIGRVTHQEGVLSVGTLHALWPFLAALVIGWAANHLLGLRHAAFRAGGLLWLVTLFGGIGLRALSGQGTALPFLVVATLALGAGLLGWRLIGILLRRAGS
ncbi:DUF3054 domain-containing protein [Ornithinimicrobium murale]|uniref:DUF3054 domain-containing protein n=1 Tax=Ornithinimicrobium murale TaxID=1050153 RepID=UPI000E0D9DC6|nr:DUF3054 domain-containing protein [Ornithinimicrobium murale]